MQRSSTTPDELSRSGPSCSLLGVSSDLMRPACPATANGRCTRRRGSRGFLPAVYLVYRPENSARASLPRHPGDEFLLSTQLSRPPDRRDRAPALCHRQLFWCRARLERRPRQPPAFRCRLSPSAVTRSAATRAAPMSRNSPLSCPRAHCGRVPTASRSPSRRARVMRRRSSFRANGSPPNLRRSTPGGTRPNPSPRLVQRHRDQQLTRADMHSAAPERARWRTFRTLQEVPHTGFRRPRSPDHVGE